jgi:hypothetical protein
MSVASILNPSTGVIAPQFLPPTPVPPPITSLSTLTMTPPGTLNFQKTNPLQAEVLSLQTSAEAQQRLTFTTNATPPLGDIIQTGAMRLIGVGGATNAPAVVVQGAGTNFSVATSSGAVPIQVSADALSLVGLTTINASAYPPANVGGTTSTSPQIPTSDLFTFTLPNPAVGGLAGKKLVATISATFTLAPSLAFAGIDATPTITFSQQSGTHVAPLPAPVQFISAPVSLLYADGTSVPSFTYTITATDTFASDGNANWTFNVDAKSPSHTYVLTDASCVGTLVVSS